MFDGMHVYLYVCICMCICKEMHDCMHACIYICHRMNGLGYCKVFGNDLGGVLFHHFIPLVVLMFFYFS